MARLKNVNNGVPGGFRFRQPQINPKWELSIHGRSSIRQAVEEVYNVRRANPALTKQHNLSLDKQVIQDEIDQFTAEGLAKAGDRYAIYLAPVVAPQFAQFDLPKSWTPQRISRGVKAAAGVVNRVLAGAKLYVKWLGSGGVPVESAQAEKRASICVSCAFNKDRGNFIDYFTQPVAEELMKIIAIKNDMNLSTSKDNLLHICDVCDCPMKAKVWTPLKHIKSELSPDVQKKLWAKCWIVNET